MPVKFKYLFYLIVSLILFACKNPDVKKENKSKKHGGSFSLVKPLVQIKQFKPSAVHVDGTLRTLSSAMEPLIQTNPVSLKTEGVLAESFTLSEDCKTVTFKIRKGVFFQDHKMFTNDKGREVKANDVKFCLDYLADTSKNNYEYAGFASIIKGLKEYHESLKNGTPLKQGVSGVTVVDNYTLKLELLKPTCTILEQLAGKATYIYPREILQQETKFSIDNLVGTGPFKLEKASENKLTFSRNNNYWKRDDKGYSLPYLDSLTFYYRDYLLGFEEQIDAFINSKIDIIEEIRAANIDMLVNKLEDTKFEYNSKEALGFGALIFNCAEKPFDNKWVRRAFSHAVNRVKIADSLFNGDFYYSDRGYSISNNFYKTPVNSNAYNLDSAKYYLRKGGYSSFKNLPPIHIKILKKSTGFIAMMDILKKETGANIIIDTVQNTKDFSKVMQSAVMGNYQCFIGTRFCDYASPKNILGMFNGEYVPNKKGVPSPINIARYKSQKVDSLLNKASKTADKNKRLSYYREAEKQLISDTPMEVLYYSEVNLLKKPSLKNLPLSVIGNFDYSTIYWNN